MKRYLVILIVVLVYSCKDKKMEEIRMFDYPETRKVDQVDNYFGTEVADPYRWLEDDNSDETKMWVTAQNEVLEKYLSSIPYREKIRERLKKVWNYPKYGVPFREGDRYFLFKNDGLQQQNVLYWLEDLDAEPKLFFDPNELSDDGTRALSTYSFSKDGKLFAYGISEGGSDWQDIFVMEVETGIKLEDHLKWIKFSGIAWKDDGFYYTRYDEPGEGKKLSGKNENGKVCYHKIGTLQSEDQVVYQNPDHPEWSFQGATTEDESFLIITGFESTSGNSMFVKSLDTISNFITIDDGFDYDYRLIDNAGDSSLLVLTNFEAPKYKVIRININAPDKENWVDVIPEKQEVLISALFCGGKIITEYMKDASSRAYVFDKDGSPSCQINLPGIGTVQQFNGRNDENIAFYSFTSYTYPTTIYKYNIKENSSEVFHKSEIDFDFENYETKQVFYESKDGTEVPMFIVCKKGTELNGNNPALLYGYGGFNISLTPNFSIGNLIFMENGGIFAVANIRGGGEYGEEWHEAGTKLNKQNVFDDFIYAAKYLISNKYTSSDKLAIRGGSNGGLLVGASMTQKPELFKVALPAVGVLDMLRYHKFTIGYYWASDYGTSEDSVNFKNLYRYSPIHNVKEGVSYPATMVTTADHDDRVVPAHSFKFIAELQAKNAGDNPVMIRIEEKAGHSAGTPTDKLIEEYTDIWTFVFKNLDVTPIY